MEPQVLAVAENGLKVTSFFRGVTSVGKALVNNECDFKGVDLGEMKEGGKDQLSVMC